MVLNISDIALKKLNINMQHALHHCLHEEKCPYYDDIEQVCYICALCMYLHICTYIASYSNYYKFQL